MLPLGILPASVRSASGGGERLGRQARAEERASRIRSSFAASDPADPAISSFRLSISLR